VRAAAIAFGALLSMGAGCDPSPSAPTSPSPSATASPGSAPETSDAAAGDATAPLASLYDIAVRTLEGEDTTLARYRGKALLIVNVASECGYTPQYEGLQKLHEELGPRGLVVLGFPCNQFGGQEPGSSEEIKAFCESKYGVEFPLFEKVEVSGGRRHPLYGVLTRFADVDGIGGDVKWNFEKFLVSADGRTVKRFRSAVTPQDPTLRAAIEAALPR
jgi:glutathione peroxidase